MWLLVAAMATAASAVIPTSAQATGVDPVADALIRCAPATYEAALDCLDANLSAGMKEQLAAPDGTVKAHFRLGAFIRNEWGLWKDGPLAGSMRQSGFTHPDDMSATILDGYVARLKHEVYDLNERAAYYRAFWARSVERTRLPDERCKPKSSADIAPQMDVSPGQGSRKTGCFIDSNGVLSIDFVQD